MRGFWASDIAYRIGNQPTDDLVLNLTRGSLDSRGRAPGIWPHRVIGMWITGRVRINGVGGIDRVELIAVCTLPNPRGKTLATLRAFPAFVHGLEYSRQKMASGDGVQPLFAFPGATRFHRTAQRDQTLELARPQNIPASPDWNRGLALPTSNWCSLERGEQMPYFRAFMTPPAIPFGKSPGALITGGEPLLRKAPG